MATRKAIMAALLAQLAPVGGTFPTSGRRLRDPEHLAGVNMPALFLIKPNERYERKSTTLPPVRVMECYAVIYTNIGDDQNAVPADIIDDLLDVVDAAMAPKIGTDGRQTLGGLVYNAVVMNDIDIAPGDIQGLGTIVIPIHITLNSDRTKS